MLKEGDIIELKEGHEVYATVPEHFLYSNTKGSFTMRHGEVAIGGELSYLAGRYVVVGTVMDGGGAGHGPHDIYPNGHHVYCESLDTQRHQVDFYQSGCFTAMLPDLLPVGHATQRWQEE